MCTEVAQLRFQVILILALTKFHTDLTFCLCVCICAHVCLSLSTKILNEKAMSVVPYATVSTVPPIS